MRKVVGALMAVLVLGLSIAIANPASDEGESSASKLRCSEFEFDRREWERGLRDAPGAGGLTVRQVVADHLTRCELLVGISEPRVLSMLGPPDQRLRTKQGQPPALMYLVGSRRGAIDTGDAENLFIEISDGRVTSATID